MICTHCGYSMAQDEVIERDGFKLDPRGATYFQDSPLRLTPAQCIILHTLADAAGRIVPRNVLAERMGFDGDSNCLHVQICKTRTFFRGCKIPNPIQTVWNVGYTWGFAA